MTRQAVLIRGDGIGPEITSAVLRILEAAGAEINWIERPAGLAALEQVDEVLPADTITAINDSRQTAERIKNAYDQTLTAVSYTHLTLPTILLV